MSGQGGRRQTEASKWRSGTNTTNTAARKHGKPGREARPKSITIDMHTHVAVPRAAEFVKPHLDVSTIPLAHFAYAETKALNAKQEADIRSRIVGNYDERFADMDEMGVDMQLVMPPPPQLYLHRRRSTSPCTAAQMINDGIAEFVAKHKPTASSRSAPCRCRTATRPPRSSSAA